MLKRKIESRMEQWKSDPDHKPLIIKGCRQCGKTYSVLRFAKKNYPHVVYLNFFENPQVFSAFAHSLNVDYIIMMLSALLPDEKFVEGKTVLIFDEIQECPDARTALKFFRLDGRFDVIATGSLLGVKGYGKEPKSIPVGYETMMDMYPLDFEEFLWANGITEPMTEMVRTYIEKEEPVVSPLHERFRELFLQYVVVGGMPEVVQKFIETKNMSDVLQVQRDIVSSYEDDMVKYASDKDKGRILETFHSIPRQLSKENKKFQYSVIKKNARVSEYVDCLQWLEDAGIIIKCHNLTTTELPLDGNAIQDVYKVYMRDCGLFVSMLEEGTAGDILLGNLYGYKGAIFENAVADLFGKMGRKLYYYRKDSG
ncbi:ATP-binding protein, partial [uncultured Dubosiella sp.]